MSKLMLLAALGAASSPSTHASERRCGWLSNPTPANWYFIDRKGEWVIGEQGQYQIPDKSWDVMPDMTTKGWVKTNGHYGYGCACMTVRVDQEQGEEFEEEAQRVLAILEPLRDAAMMAARAAATLAKAVASVPAPRTRAGWRYIRENWAVNAVPARIDVRVRAAASRFPNYDVWGRPRRGRRGRRKRQQSNENCAR
jgi:hypothetical protein